MFKKLCPEVVIEPLIAGFYANPMMYDPFSFPFFLKNVIVPKLESYLEFPQMHFDSQNDPEMYGSDFVVVDPLKVNEVRAFKEALISRFTAQLSFADEVSAMKLRLKSESGRGNLRDLYNVFSPGTRRFVELFYNSTESVDFRFFHSLLYQSELHSENKFSTQIRFLPQKKREFCNSTPYIFHDEQKLIINAHPNNQFLNELYAMASRGVSDEEISKICAGLGISEADLEPFLVEDKQIADPSENPEGITFFGHACVGIQAGGRFVLIDPLVARKSFAEHDNYSLLDLPQTIDCLLLTHAHADHFQIETLQYLKHKTDRVIVPKGSVSSVFDVSMRRILLDMGFSRVDEYDVFETIEIQKGFRISLMPFLGEHGDLEVFAKAGYLVEYGNFSAMFLADAKNVNPDLYRLASDALPRIDHLFLGMESEGAPMSWSYGALFFEKISSKSNQARRLNGCNAAEAHDLINILKPAHVHIYAMGMEPWLSHIMGLQYTEASPQIAEVRSLMKEMDKSAAPTPIDLLYLKKFIPLKG